MFSIFNCVVKILPNLQFSMIDYLKKVAYSALVWSTGPPWLYFLEQHSQLDMSNNARHPQSLARRVERI
jgi:hypothetical protein